MGSRTGRVWGAIGVTAAIDLGWLWWSGITIPWLGGVPLLGAIGLLLGVAWFYGTTGRSDALQCMAITTAQFLAFSASGAILSYLVATTPMPLTDALLARADAILGFHWGAWANWTYHHPAVHVTLVLAYVAELPATIFCLLYLANRQEAEEFLWLYMLTGLVTVLISGVVPALGHFPHSRAARQVLALRAGTLSQIPIPHVEGLISFPSFHTSLALVIAYTLRTTRVRWVMACLTGVILCSIPTEGGHYLVDMLGGVGVTGVAVAIMNYVLSPVAAERYEGAGSFGVPSAEVSDAV